MAQWRPHPADAQAVCRAPLPGGEPATAGHPRRVAGSAVAGNRMYSHRYCGPTCSNCARCSATMPATPASLRPSLNGDIASSPRLPRPRYSVAGFEQKAGAPQPSGLGRKRRRIGRVPPRDGRGRFRANGKCSSSPEKWVSARPPWSTLSAASSAPMARHAWPGARAWRASAARNLTIR